jgi:IS605 OrfB family transposase
VDLGVVNIATTLDGEIVNQGQRGSHAHLNTVRARYARVGAKLQKPQTRSAKRPLKKRGGRERRFAQDVNHCISRASVQTAKGTRRGMALEHLQNSRGRAPVRGKRQRRVLHRWAFCHLRSVIAYIADKAQAAGVCVVVVNPAYTSQSCSRCGHCERANRTSQARFLCVSCGCSAHADANAAVNIGRAAVIPPDVAPRAGGSCKPSA